MYYSADIMKEDEQLIADHPEATVPDFLTILSQNRILKHELCLKEGWICSPMRNVSIRKGPVKNTRFIVQHLRHCYVEVRVINNRTGRLGDVQCIPQIRFEFTPPRASWTVYRLCFTSRLAYAATFNGWQGLTAVLDLRCNLNIFTHGQLYTTLSRIRVRGDSRILFSDDKNDHDYNTPNVVYQELLLEFD